SWVDAERKEWLEKKLAEFMEVRKKDDLGSFWPPVYEDYDERWPLSAPTAEEIAEYSGDEEAVSEAKQEAQRNRIYWWIYNNSRGSSRHKKTQKSLKLSKRRKIIHPYQAYYHL
ncbi:hypothetical protein CERSUDRAFT_36270, partial [Gelatoporia subvermispora B]